LFVNILKIFQRLLEKLTGSKLVKKFPAFMELEGTLRRLKVPATCPYQIWSTCIKNPWQEKILDGGEGKLIGPFKSRFLYIGVGNALVKGKEKVKMVGVGENERSVLQLHA
jgi:hypothetical protein